MSKINFVLTFFIFFFFILAVDILNENRRYQQMMALEKRMLLEHIMLREECLRAMPTIPHSDVSYGYLFDQNLSIYAGNQQLLSNGFGLKHKQSISPVTSYRERSPSSPTNGFDLKRKHSHSPVTFRARSPSSTAEQQYLLCKRKKSCPQ